MARVFTITPGLENMGAMKTGGQGSVYKGRRMGEIITAIKLLPTPIYSESSEDKNFTSFQNEVQKLKKVNEIPNPNVVKILSSGITDSGNFPYIEMEFIEGPDLEDLLKPPHDPLFTIKEVLKVADHLSAALAHCHKVDVRHGDIKSNNVKFNTNTGNYVLLDFGLSVMSDEERRSSLRHAGAIEFMAPEQNEGKMLFQTDVYSCGIVLFELLTGSVPFPLKDKGETARNMVMVAHMEAPLPDLLLLRKKNLPANWSAEKREHEMQVPDWLVTMVYKCLEKRPENRFENGVVLHDFIWKNSIRTASKNENVDEQLQALLKENKRLFREKEQLQQQLLQYRQGKPGNHASNPYMPVTGEMDDDSSSVYRQPASGFPGKTLLWSLLLLIGIAALVYYLVQKNKPVTTTETKTPPKTATSNAVVGQYIVTATRAYFYNEPDENTRRNAFAIPSNEVVKAYDDQNGFIYTSITNEKGQVSKGWLRKQDLVTLAEWKTRQKEKEAASNTEAENTASLNEARQLLNNNQLPEALAIYRSLSEKQVPEAMYEYANLALQNKNENISCAGAFQLLENASVKGYAPAKRTLGFLYCFADNDEVLKASNYYERCTFSKNVSKGSQLLIEAMLQGDTTANRLLEQLNANR